MQKRASDTTHPSFKIIPIRPANRYTVFSDNNLVAGDLPDTAYCNYKRFMNPDEIWLRK